MVTKVEFRKRSLQLLSELSSEEKSRQEAILLDRLILKIEQLSIRSIMLYMPIKDEISLLPIIDRYFNKIDIYLPVVDGDNIKIGKFNGYQNMVQDNNYKILEPIDIVDNLSTIDLIVVPGIGFTKDGIRLGRGKGYYDRFLSSQNYGETVALSFKELIYEHIPHDHLDINVDSVITP